MVAVAAAVLVTTAALAGLWPDGTEPDTRDDPSAGRPEPEPGPVDPGSGVPAGWRVAFSDEFDGAGVDTSVWRRYHNTYGDGNNELACLTPDNVRTEAGTLHIEARRQDLTCPDGKRRDFSSGFLGTRETGTYFPRYARYEIRARIPHGQGLWPAFWLRHRNGASTAEVDIMEYFHSQVPGRTTGTLHLDGRYNISKRTTTVENPTTTPGWHTWAVEIEPDPNGGIRFRFLLDDTEYHRYTDTQHHWASAPADATWDMAINLAVGGNWVGHPDDSLGYLRDLDRCAQDGTPPNCRTDNIQRWTGTPTTYDIDWVRVLVR